MEDPTTPCQLTNPSNVPAWASSARTHTRTYADTLLAAMDPLRLSSFQIIAHFRARGCQSRGSLSICLAFQHSDDCCKTTKPFDRDLEIWSWRLTMARRFVRVGSGVRELEVFISYIKLPLPRVHSNTSSYNLSSSRDVFMQIHSLQTLTIQYTRRKIIHTTA